MQLDGEVNQRIKEDKDKEERADILVGPIDCCRWILRACLIRLEHWRTVVGQEARPLLTAFEILPASGVTRRKTLRKGSIREDYFSTQLLQWSILN